MPDLDLDAIEQRAAAATPGPWTFWDNRGKQCTWAEGTPNGAPLGEDHQGVKIGGWNATLTTAADSQFIAAARVDVPALVAEVRRLRAEVDGLKQTQTVGTATMLGPWSAR